MADPQIRGCGPLTIKYLVFFFNLIFFLSGLILIAVGGVAQGFFHQYIQFFEGQYETPAIGIIILGGIILVVSFFGCCGAKKENVFMLRIFICLMVVILMCEIAAAITVAVLRPDIEKLIKKNLNETMNQYGDPKDLPTLAWNDMQINHKCCGVMNYLDWEKTPYGMNVTGVPDSCCILEKPDCGHNIFGLIPTDNSSAPPNIYSEGCYQALHDAAMSNIGAIAGGIAGLAFFQILGIWMSSCLIKSARERYEIL
ncbi:CD63 antigen-like [Macrobrachium rosenbergii]|uniref:CD63 antigen-like n=1 Tax=Macrobrachium rosenbergii TaxID=79674 RepID=UPI0034D6657D